MRSCGIISGRFAAMYPENAGREAYVQPLNIGPAQRLSSLFSVLLGLTGLVTLIVCSNVANLLMLRGAARRYEIGVCLALGCGRGRVIGQLLCESMLLAGAGAMLGVAVAWSGQQLLPALMPPSPLPIALQASLNGRILGFGVLLAAAMVPIFGLLPAIHAFKGAVMPSLRLARGGRGTGVQPVAVGAGRRAARPFVDGPRLRRRVPAVADGAFARSIGGFSSAGSGMLVSTDFDQAGYRSPSSGWWPRIACSRESARCPEWRRPRPRRSCRLDSADTDRSTSRCLATSPPRTRACRFCINSISGGYFQTMGIQVQAGRAVDERDTAGTARVAVVNQAFVQRFLSGREPIGLTIDAGSGPVTVIGVAANGRYRFDRLEESSPPFMYLSYAQQSAALVTVHVRSAAGPAISCRRSGRSSPPSTRTCRSSASTTLDECTSLPMFPVRLGTTILSSLGLVALLLAATGLYGVMAYRVAQRRGNWRSGWRSARRASGCFGLVFGDGAR